MYFSWKWVYSIAVLVYQRVNQIVLPFLRFKKMARARGMLKFTIWIIYYSRSNIRVQRKKTVFPSCFPSLVDNFVAGNQLSQPWSPTAIHPWKMGLTAGSPTAITSATAQNLRHHNATSLERALGSLRKVGTWRWAHGGAIEVVKGGENVQKRRMRLLRNISWFWSLDCTYCIILYSASSGCN